MKADLKFSLEGYGIELGELTAEEEEFMETFANSFTLKVEVLLLKRRLDKLEKNARS
jgi:hypothetical protein